MKLKDYKKEDLEAMSYSELTSLILNEKGSKMKIVDVFKKICELLELGESTFESKIADFFELISTDKNIIVLDKGFCDLKTKHNKAVVIEEDEEELPEETEEIETDDDIEPEENVDDDEDIFYDDASDDEDIDEDDLDDFAVVEDEEASM